MEKSDKEEQQEKLTCEQFIKENLPSMFSQSVFWYSEKPYLHALLGMVWCQAYWKIMEFSKAMCFPIVFREKEKAPTETL